MVSEVHIFNVGRDAHSFSRVEGVENVLICQRLITYRDDVMLEDAWHEEVEAVGVNHTMVSRLAQGHLRWLRL